MTTADEIEMQMKIACDKLGLSAKDMAKALNTIQPMPFNAGAIFRVDNDWSNWRKTISIWPRESISGKTIFGYVNKRGKTFRGAHGSIRVREFATDKELFKAKLYGDA